MGGSLECDLVVSAGKLLDVCWSGRELAGIEHRTTASTQRFMLLPGTIMSGAVRTVG